MPTPDLSDDDRAALRKIAKAIYDQGKADGAGGVAMDRLGRICGVSPNPTAAERADKRPRYCVWANGKVQYLCGDLAEALVAARECSGTVYEPLGMTITEEICREAAAFRRGAEAMRAACADYALDMAGDQGRLANGIAALPVPEDRP